MSQSSREEGNSSFKSMENGNGHHHVLQIQGPPVIEKQRTPKKSSNHTYIECQKNHAAALGRDSRDGCGEFMPGGEEGTLEALNCAACNCHRNFHRKEAIEEDDDGDHEMVAPELVGYPTNFQMMTPSERAGMMRKRSRTKFTKEQKVKMSEFAKKVGWKLQRIEDSVVEKFCEEIGIKRRVLKVWMQNNKHVHLGINRNNSNNNNGNNNNNNSNNNGNSSSSNQI